MTEFNKIVIHKFLAMEFGRMANTRQDKILDLGCGSRPYLDLYKHIFDHCVSADYEFRGIIDVRSDAAHLPFKNASFDVVLMTEVIEHVREANQVLAEVHRVLKPGGLLLITWPFNYMMHEIPFDHTRYTEYGMESRMTEAGMQIETLLRRGNAIMLAIVLLEFFFLGFAKLLSHFALFRKWVEKPVRLCITYLFSLIYNLYLFIAWRRAKDKTMSVGAGQKGALGHLSLWNLGYCARVRKSEAGP